MSYEFLRRGGVAHKMDSNFSMLGAMLIIIDHWNAYEISYFLRLLVKSYLIVRGFHGNWAFLKISLIIIS